MVMRVCAYGGACARISWCGVCAVSHMLPACPQIDMLKDKILEGYFLGAVGNLDCPDCSYSEPGSQDPAVPMSAACRACHYPLEDYLNTDVRECLHAGPTSKSCMSPSRGLSNFYNDVYGEVNIAAVAVAAAAAAAAVEAAEAEEDS